MKTTRERVQKMSEEELPEIVFCKNCKMPNYVYTQQLNQKIYCGQCLFELKFDDSKLVN